MAEEHQYIYSGGVRGHSNTIIILLSIQKSFHHLDPLGHRSIILFALLRLLILPTTTVLEKKHPIGVNFMSTGRG